MRRPKKRALNAEEIHKALRVLEAHADPLSETDRRRAILTLEAYRDLQEDIHRASVVLSAQSAPYAAHAPPAQAELFAALFIKPELRDHLLGDRAEQFSRDVERRGRPWAVCLYWWDAARSIGPALWTLTKRLGSIGALASLCKRITGW